MPIRTDPTPNPNALKFTVGKPVGGPGTFVKGSDPEPNFVGELLDIEGVVSVFITADFVTLTKSPTSDWEQIASQAGAILETEFGD